MNLSNSCKRTYINLLSICKLEHFHIRESFLQFDSTKTPFWDCAIHMNTQISTQSVLLHREYLDGKLSRTHEDEIDQNSFSIF